VEWKGGTVADFQAFKAAQKAELIDGMLSPFVEQRAKLTTRQAYITTELQRLRDLQAGGDGDGSIDDQIAALESEWELSRQVEARINSEEAIAKNTVAHLRD